MATDAIEFNTNHEVQIRLTEWAREYLPGWHQRTWAELGRPQEEYVPPQEDDDGWSTWQLWVVMQTFGSTLYNGGPNPFETTIRIPTSKLDLEPALRQQIGADVDADALGVAADELEEAGKFPDAVTALRCLSRILGASAPTTG